MNEMNVEQVVSWQVVEVSVNLVLW
jgi:hypothetical protein